MCAPALAARLFTMQRRLFSKVNSRARSMISAWAREVRDTSRSAPTRRNFSADSAFHLAIRDRYPAPGYSVQHTPRRVDTRRINECGEESGKEVGGGDDEDVVELVVLQGLSYGVAGCYEDEREEGEVEPGEEGAVEEGEEEVGCDFRDVEFRHGEFEMGEDGEEVD